MRVRAFVVFALLALACKDHEEINREAALKETLTVMRGAIAAYQAEHGRYPSSLQDLVPKHLRSIPADPMGGGEWRVTTEETVQPSSDFQTTTSAAPAPVVVDVHSSAPGADRNGVPYANY